MDRAAFEAEITRDGYDMREAAVTPNERRPMHTHEFDARLLILDGVFILASPEGEAILHPGETCFVPAGTVHAEYGGPEGARYLAARRAVG